MLPPLTSHPYTQKVRRYYDANTSIFRLFEPKGDTIHRAVWAPGVTGRRAAIEYTNELVAVECEPFAPLRIVDLGCGTGGTFLFLADRLSRSRSWRGLAVTLSPLQVARARENFSRSGITDRCTVVEADYVNVPDDGPFDVAVAIESFVHCPEPPSFFREVARLLAPGGRLLLCDDILSERADSTPLTRSEEACMREFSRGWLAPAPQSVRSIVSFASDAGLRLVSNTNLTPWLHLLPGRGLVRPFLRLGGIDRPLVRSLTGGLALQLALGQGLLEYRWMCFEK